MGENGGGCVDVLMVQLYGGLKVEIWREKGENEW